MTEPTTPENFRPSDYIKGVDDSTFCIMPFMHMSTTTNGEYRLCCRSSKVTEINHNRIHEMFPDRIKDNTESKMLPKNIWQGKRYNEIRERLINGERESRCNACWKMEDRGIVSLRQTQNFERVERFADAVREWQETGNVAWRVPIFEFKLSNICNLRCRMCWPKDSTPWVKSWDAIKHLLPEGEREYMDVIWETNNMSRQPILNLFAKDPEFINQMMQNLQYVEEMEFAGGEPLLDPLHYELISKIPHPENVILKYSTNLTDLEFKKGRNVLDIWRKFKGVRLTISIDGHESLNAMIRHGSRWDELRTNIQLVKEQLGDKIHSLRGSTTVSAMNALELVETMDAIEQDLGIRWHTSRLQWPEYLHANVLPRAELAASKDKILARIDQIQSEHDTLPIGISKEKEIMINRMRHLKDAERWLTECIENNQYIKNYNRYQEFMDIMNKEDKENGIL